MDSNNESSITLALNMPLTSHQHDATQRYPFPGAIGTNGGFAALGESIKMRVDKGCNTILDARLIGAHENRSSFTILASSAICDQLIATL